MHLRGWRLTSGTPPGTGCSLLAVETPRNRLGRTHDGPTVMPWRRRAGTLVAAAAGRECSRVTCGAETHLDSCGSWVPAGCLAMLGASVRYPAQGCEMRMSLGLQRRCPKCRSERGSSGEGSSEGGVARLFVGLLLPAAPGAQVVPTPRAARPRVDVVLPVVAADQTQNTAHAAPPGGYVFIVHPRTPRGNHPVVSELHDGARTDKPLMAKGGQAAI